MNSLIQRTLTGAAFVVVLLGALYWSSYSTVALMGIFAALGLYEFYHLAAKQPNTQLEIGKSVVGGLALYALFTFIFFGKVNPIYLIFILPLLFLFFVNELYKVGRLPLNNVSIVAMGWLYVALPFYLIVEIRDFYPAQSLMYVFGLFILVWSNDTFAYLTGKFFGKTKLFERISPNKTWEGTIGGIVFTFVAALLIVFLAPADLLFWLISALIISLAAIFGDLFQSMLKRSVNVKDSGSILPGHGGILDRFDAMLFAAPFFYAWMVLYYNF